MPIKTYQDLIIWQNAFSVTKLIITYLRKIPDSIESRIIKSQLIRASTSIGANVAEGYGRYGPKEFTRYLQVALGSANESEYWLLILRDIYPYHSEDTEKLIAKNKETIKMLASAIKTIKSKRN